MRQFVIEIDDTDLKALEYTLLDVNEWIQQAVKGKIANCQRRAIEAESTLNFKKLTPIEIKSEISKLNLKKRKDID